MTCKYCEGTGIVSVDYRDGYALEKCGCGCTPDDFVPEFYPIEDGSNESYIGLNSSARNYIKDIVSNKALPGVFLDTTFHLVRTENIILSDEIEHRGILLILQSDEDENEIIELKEEIQNKDYESDVNDSIFTYLKMKITSSYLELEYDLFCWSLVPSNTTFIDYKNGTYWQ